MRICEVIQSSPIAVSLVWCRPDYTRTRDAAKAGNIPAVFDIITARSVTKTGPTAQAMRGVMLAEESGGCKSACLTVGQ